jgi:hypothetical protein
MSAVEEKPPTLKPLKITCTSSDCDNDLHCFKATRKMKSADQAGKCRSCGADLIDWRRLRSRDLQDIDHTFAALRQELIRHHFWHIPFSSRAINYAHRMGRIGLREAVETRLRKSVGPAEPFRDGQQTPMKNITNPIHYAQHATASCCRTCIEYWHGIQKGHDLADDFVLYLRELNTRFLDERLPHLTDMGENVPPIRQPKQSKTKGIFRADD